MREDVRYRYLYKGIGLGYPTPFCCESKCKKKMKRLKYYIHNRIYYGENPKPGKTHEKNIIKKK